VIKHIGEGEGAIDGWKRWMREQGKDPENPPRNPKTGNVLGRPNFLLQRLKLDECSPTVVSGGCLLHPTDERYISVKEAQLLCGYPPDYEFVGADAYAQISKAVLPPVGAWLGRCLAAGVKQDIRITDPGAPRLIDFRKPLEQAP
jgi:site-specific DNA-cytosine methylase